MLTRLYIEALDEELADQVWKAWDAGGIDDQLACIAWWLIAGGCFTPNSGRWSGRVLRGRCRPKGGIKVFLPIIQRDRIS